MTHYDTICLKLHAYLTLGLSTGRLHRIRFGTAIASRNYIYLYYIGFQKKYHKSNIRRIWRRVAPKQQVVYVINCTLFYYTTAYLTRKAEFYVFKYVHTF